MSNSQEDNVLQCLIQMATVLGKEISMKFIPIPSKEAIVTDIIHADRQLQERLRWKDWFRSNRMINKLDLDSDEYSVNTVDTNKVLSAAREENEGFGMGLKPKLRVMKAPLASASMENFINQISIKLIKEAETNLRPITANTNDASTRIYQFLRRLKLIKDKVHILTDKTNTFKLVDRDKYIK